MTSTKPPVSNSLAERFQQKQGHVGIIGLGYVGLPLLLEFSRAGFQISGFDCDASKIEQLNAGRSYIRHFPDERIAQEIRDAANVSVTTDFSAISACDALLICVPTPLTGHREPDLSYITGTAQEIAPYLRPGQLICLESTTYPGTTEDVLIPELETHSGLQGGTDFLVAYSPEREDPCNRDFSTSTIPKVVGGVNAPSLAAAQALYETIICRTVPVSSCRTAEATKLMENIFRCVNIALVNELKVVFAQMGIDVWEVIEAAKTKPFGYMPFYPGPGLGGHCIPIDPFYLTWKAREYDVATRFIELAGEINTSMPDYVIQQTMAALNEQKKPLNGSRVLLVGLAYKANVDDIRESPTLILWEKFVQNGACVSYYDPLCPEIRRTRNHPQLAGIKSIREAELDSGAFDAAIVCTAHECVDHERIVRAIPLVVDTRNACPRRENVRHA